MGADRVATIAVTVGSLTAASRLLSVGEGKGAVMPAVDENESRADLVAESPDPYTPAEVDEFLANIGANDWAAFWKWAPYQWPRMRRAGFVVPLLALAFTAGMLVRAPHVGSVAGWLAGGLALGSVAWHAATATSGARWVSRLVSLASAAVFAGGVWTLVSLGLDGSELRFYATDGRPPLAIASACAALGLGAVAFVWAVHRLDRAGSWEAPICCVYVLMFLRSVFTLDALGRSEGVGRFEILEAHATHAGALPGLWVQWRSVQQELLIAFVCGWFAFFLLALVMVRERRAMRDSPYGIVALPLLVLVTFAASRDLVSALTLSRPELSTLNALMSSSLPEWVALAETALDLAMAPLFGLVVCAAGAALVLVGTARRRATRPAIIAAIVTMSCSLLWGATEDRLSERFGLVRDSSALDRGRPPNVVYQTKWAHDGVPRAVSLSARRPRPAVPAPSDELVDCGGVPDGVDPRTEFEADGIVYGRDIEAPERRSYAYRWTWAYKSYPPDRRPHGWEDDPYNKYPWLTMTHLGSWIIMTGSRPEIAIAWLAMLVGPIIGWVIRRRRRSRAAAAGGPFRTGSPTETTQLVGDRADWARVLAVAGATIAVALSFALGAAV